MSIRFRCPGCGREYNLKDEYAGKNIKCKIETCKTLMTVPDAPIQVTQETYQQPQAEYNQQQANVGQQQFPNQALQNEQMQGQINCPS